MAHLVRGQGPGPELQSDCEELKFYGVNALGQPNKCFNRTVRN